MRAKAPPPKRTARRWLVLAIFALVLIGWWAAPAGEPARIVEPALPPPVMAMKEPSDPEPAVAAAPVVISKIEDAGVLPTPQTPAELSRLDQVRMYETMKRWSE